MSAHALSVDAWREAGAILDHFAYHLRSLCVVPAGIVLVVDGDDPLGPGQVLLCRDDELASPCWSGPALRGAPQHPILRHDLAPTGYADLLRLVASLATMAAWDAPRIVMGARRMLISYLVDGVSHEQILTPERVYQCLNDVFWHRAPGSPSGPTDMVHRPSPGAHGVQHRAAPPVPYAMWLAALGRYLGQEAGRGAPAPSALLIEELVDQQMLVVYRTADGTQRAHVVDNQTLRALCTEHPSRRKEKGTLALLSALGRQIDAMHGWALSAHQRSREGFVLAYTRDGEGAGLAPVRVRDSWAPDDHKQNVSLMPAG